MYVLLLLSLRLLLQFATGATGLRLVGCRSSSDSGNNSSTVTMTTVTALNAAWRVCARGAHEMAQTQLAQEVPDLSVPARGESFG